MGKWRLRFRERISMKKKIIWMVVLAVSLVFYLPSLISIRNNILATCLALLAEVVCTVFATVVLLHVLEEYPRIRKKRVSYFYSNTCAKVFELLLRTMILILYVIKNILLLVLKVEPALIMQICIMTCLIVYLAILNVKIYVVDDKLYTISFSLALADIKAIQVHKNLNGSYELVFLLKDAEYNLNITRRMFLEMRENPSLALYF